MSEQMILPVNDNRSNWGDWGPAVAGLIFGGMFSNGGWGFGGRGGAVAGQVGADVVIQSGLQNLQNAVQNGTVSNLQSSQAVQNSISQNTIANMQSAQLMSDKIGNAAMQVSGQVASQGQATTAAITQQTIQNLQGQANLSQQVAGGFANAAQQLCQCCNSMQQTLDATGDQITQALNDARVQSMQNTQAISDKLSALNQNITNQGYESQLRMQSLAAQNEQQHCQDRELMRQIQAENQNAKLAEAQAKIVQLETQNYVNNSNSQQTLYLISQLKPTTTAASA